MNVKMSNIENHMYRFKNNNTDFNGYKWAEPIFVGMVRAYQTEKELDLYIDNDYIRQMILSDYNENRTYSPIERIYDKNNLEKISNHTSSIMIRNFPSLNEEDEKDLREYLQYLFLELMNNVADHSHSRVGAFTMSQYFSTNRKVQFVVADRGIGFLKNIKLKYQDINCEEEAIMVALEKGITATQARLYGQERNAGYGLYAMSEILKLTRGKFVIISNDTLVRFDTINGFLTKKLSTPWKGVVVAFEFDESQINYDMDYFKRTYLWSEISEIEDEDFYL